MIFEPERDRFFTVYIIKVVIVMTLMYIFPFIFAEETRILPFIVVWTGLYLFMLSTVVFTTLNIQYEFRSDHLYVKGGPFSRKVPYSKIYRIRTTFDIYDGHRVITAGEALEIFYEGRKPKSVKITPKNREEFLAMLEVYSPQAKMTL
ncbi:hypothetical protein EQV77_16125 [Halobacillus fulvus]|nr:hypothetical protein EQV77_16125 [Halobacillus fulvus]